MEERKDIKEGNKEGRILRKEGTKGGYYGRMERYIREGKTDGRKEGRILRKEGKKGGY